MAKVTRYILSAEVLGAPNAHGWRYGSVDKLDGKVYTSLDSARKAALSLAKKFKGRYKGKEILSSTVNIRRYNPKTKKVGIITGTVNPRGEYDSIARYPIKTYRVNKNGSLGALLDICD